MKVLRLTSQVLTACIFISLLVGIQVSSDLQTWSPDPVAPLDGTSSKIVEDTCKDLVIRDLQPVDPSTPRFLKLVRTDP